MLAVIQRIKEAAVVADGQPYSECGKGFLVLLGISVEDTEDDARILAEKISKLRVFEDTEDKMNLSVNDIGGSVMVVPNFTIMADYRKGNRPAFIYSAKPEPAEVLFDYFCDYISGIVPAVSRGKFRSDMQVSLINDGPVTIPMDSRVLKGTRTV